MTYQISATPAWQALGRYAQVLSPVHLRDQFAADPQRGMQYICASQGLILDYSKQRVDKRVMSLLADLARESKLGEHMNAMFAGDSINRTEQRPVLHTALRHLQRSTLEVNGQNIMPSLRDNVARMTSLFEQLKPSSVTDIVNIGIGGSDLGVRLAVEALKDYQQQVITPHFVSNVDSTHLCDTLNQLNPESTLVIIASKSFTTPDTMTNARSALLWLGERTPHQAYAVTADADAARQLGIAADRIFSIPSWVGGRYSIWSVMALPLVLAIGPSHFADFLQGAHDMDEHFASVPFENNMPVLLALLGIWNINFLGLTAHAMLPYCQRLCYLPDYLMQLDMESNGKRTDQQGKPLDYVTGPLLFGGVGTNGQHAYHQHLLQSQITVPMDFIAVLKSNDSYRHHHEQLLASCFSQSETLALGISAEEIKQHMQQDGQPQVLIERLVSHQVIPGNKPSNTLLLEQLTPYTLGALLALYEHKIFVQGVIWGINSFDQFGVEAGKQWGADVSAALQGQQQANNSSTRHLINLYRKNI